MNIPYKLLNPCKSHTGSPSASGYTSSTLNLFIMILHAENLTWHTLIQGERCTKLQGYGGRKGKQRSIDTAYSFQAPRVS